MTEKTVQITNQRNQIDTVRKLFDDYSKENKLTEKTSHDIQMALDELLTNIVSYGYEDTDEHWIDVHFNIDNGALTVEIVDDSKPYNILDRDDPDLSLSVEENLTLGTSKGGDGGKWNLERIYELFPVLAKRCLLYTSPSPRDGLLSRMPSSA